ncbi:Enoyl-CoA hydratase/carnithine racemase [Microlunatus sagamiharensis]|uniref:Enoyl-CoA hydratase/carnithine racemase n=1 Tax=Microlunatus sagamiharensis TaxID=546874 RepID=A0A1H2N539_9ACTN|nr:Enoyl-CoA hydratase/carnithine racemase [Microlunatus sagamiharensis]
MSAPGSVSLSRGRGPDRAVAVVRLENGRLSPITDAMRARLREVADELGDDPDVRAVVLSSASAASLSVGSDLNGFPTDTEAGLRVSQVEHEAYAAWAELPQPVVAVLRGHTLGGGLELSLTADVRVVEQDAVLGFPEVAVGVFASGGGTQRLPALVGAGRAARLLLLGESIDAATALDWGLATEPAATGEGEAVAMALARRLAVLPRGGVQATKHCLRTGLLHGAAAGHAEEATRIAALYPTRDVREGVAAFLGKRPAVFTHD